MSKLNEDKMYQQKIWKEYEFAKSEFEKVGISLSVEKHEKMKLAYTKLKEVADDIFSFNPSIKNLKIHIRNGL